MAFSIKSGRLRLVFVVYWVLLGYMVAALVWWFIALNRQNIQMMDYKEQQLKKDDPGYLLKMALIEDEEKRKTAQYAGEGIIFLLLILGGAVFVFRAVRRQLKQGRQRQHFMMAITHELKTPIAVAKLNLETLQKRRLDEQLQQRLLQNTLQETNRLNALCNNLLLSSQMEAGGYRVTNEELNLTELVNECVTDFNSRFMAREVVFTAREKLFVYGDRFLLQMAVNNLIDNALKYSPKECSVAVSLDAAGSDVLLRVADNGRGIDDAEKEKIFARFYRTGNAATKTAKGTGLGLYLTQKIVKQHKATITVTDNSPSGAVFTIRLKKSHNTK
jgi:two-component system, OmpR family, sensor histidine kinase CiaH